MRCGAYKLAPGEQTVRDELPRADGAGLVRRHPDKLRAGRESQESEEGRVRPSAGFRRRKKKLLAARESADRGEKLAAAKCTIHIH